MILGPTVTYRVGASPRLSSIEADVPGAEVYAWTGTWTRLDKVRGAIPNAWEVRVALHSAWLAEPLLAVESATYSPDCAAVMPTVFADMHRPWLRAYGDQLCDVAWRRGELTDEFMDVATDYQRAAPAWTATRPWALLRWPVGSGKTPGALAAIAASTHQRILVLCPAAARKEWRAGADNAKRRRTNVERFSRFEPFVLLPPGEWTDAGDSGPEALAEGHQRGLRALGEYLGAHADTRQVLVLAIESMDTHLETVRRFKPQMIVIDEIHKLGDYGAWKQVALADGETGVERTTTGGGRLTRAAQAIEICHARSVRQRVALSGTPLDDGTPRRFYMPLHLLSPGGFGRYGSAFAFRYCAKHLDDKGFPDDSGVSNFAELRQRVAFLMFDVSREESHAAMPPMRIEVDYFKRSDLQAPVALRAQIRKLAKDAKRDPKARAQLRETLLAEAASMKKALIIRRCAEFLAGGQKVMIFLSRQDLCETWAEALRASGAPGWVAHGGLGPARCDAAVNAYDVQEGAAWLVGTWYAVGESKNGMQGTHLGVVGQLPLKPSEWIQGVGRWDRMDGVGTLVWVPLADDTQDVYEVQRIIRKFGPIEQFLKAPELRALSEALEGDDDDAWLDALADKLARKS